jgi:hypothetical protein
MKFKRSPATKMDCTTVAGGVPRELDGQESAQETCHKDGRHAAHLKPQHRSICAHTGSRGSFILQYFYFTQKITRVPKSGRHIQERTHGHLSASRLLLSAASSKLASNVLVFRLRRQIGAKAKTVLTKEKKKRKVGAHTFPLGWTQIDN